MLNRKVKKSTRKKRKLNLKLLIAGWPYRGEHLHICIMLIFIIVKRRLGLWQILSSYKRIWQKKWIKFSYERIWQKRKLDQMFYKNCKWTNLTADKADLIQAEQVEICIIQVFKKKTRSFVSFQSNADSKWWFLTIHNMFDGESQDCPPQDWPHGGHNNICTFALFIWNLKLWKEDHLCERP